MVKPFRFSVNMVTLSDGAEWAARCRRAEDIGYDVIQVADHLGMPAPFPAMVAAAAATERPRIGTFVLNAAFWNPALLAREVATVDSLIGGRLEVGIGAGYVREEHETAGILYRSPGGRVDHLARTVEELDRFLRDEKHVPKPSQRPRPPLLIAGGGDRVLKLAAERADVVAFAGGLQVTPGELRVLSAEGLDERVARYREFAAGRTTEAELNLLIQLVVITDDRRAALREYCAFAPYLTEEEVLGLPVLAVGTVEEIAAQFRATRERYGFSYFSVLEPYMEAFAPVVEELRGT
ncbi:TIGR03621 family F420-dependent LLM class oxidoreductase [Streptomyces sp. NPDC088745]|uniref:TIGR03621 family F420-dependent LLM class oxidoreductase n=1 Tax=Streptomyces sp. NPDC088745 TaxID=3365884 RepID=UPI0038138844